MKWIPVSERLPEPYQLVLVYEEKFAESDRRETSKGWSGTVYRPAGVRSGYLCSVGFRTEGTNGKCVITHWMPLPEPPEEV